MTNMLPSNISLARGSTLKSAIKIDEYQISSFTETKKDQKEERVPSDKENPQEGGSKEMISSLFKNKFFHAFYFSIKIFNLEFCIS